LAKGKKSSVVSRKKSSSRRAVKRDTPLEHFLVPKHEVLSDGEKLAVMKQFSITEKNFSLILCNDPAIAHIQPKPGDLVKISRDDPTVGKYTFYRLVVER
jgi:DNA-directed RNA polymerase subunit H (RpoH/RPB5)